MRNILGWMIVAGTLATAAFGGTASARERARDQDAQSQYSRYAEHRNQQRRERALREHHVRERADRDCPIGSWP